MTLAIKALTKKFAELYSKLDYRFNDPTLLAVALTHRSVKHANNERLEFLGDSILNFIIAEALFNKFKKAKEGELSRLRASLVRGLTLAEIAKEFELSEHIHLGVGEVKSGGAYRESILADAVEAIIGAMYIDGGFDVCQERVLAWYADRIESIASAEELKDPKSKLQEYLQSKKYPLPTYEIASTTGEAHDQTFYVECRVANLKYIGKGNGSNRRKAEQKAATDFLKKLRRKK